MHRKINYNDVPFFLIVIPFINGLNYYLSYTGIRLNSYFIITFCIDTSLGYLAWMGIRHTILYLDKKINFLQRPLKRLPIQLLLTCIAGLSIIILFTEAINAVAKTTPVPASFYTHDIFLFLIWFLVINGIYCGIYFYKVWQQAEAEKKETHKREAGGFSLKIGNTHKKIDFDAISAFMVEGSYTTLITHDGRDHMADVSLDKVVKMLPKDTFFRINRQALVNRQAISGYKKDVNGKLLITVQFTGRQILFINMSRTKAPEFKEWFKEGLATA